MKAKHLTPLKAIRSKCLDCAGGRPSLVRQCESAGCPLHFYRFGRNPNRKGCGAGFFKPSAAKKADTAQVFKGNNVFEGHNEGKPILTNLGVFNTGIKIEETSGKITIHRMDKSIFIKLTQG